VPILKIKSNISKSESSYDLEDPKDLSSVHELYPQYSNFKTPHDFAKYLSKHHMEASIEEKPKTAGQFYVDFAGVPKTREKKGSFALWDLSKKQLGDILDNWDHHTWNLASASRPSTPEKHHSTAITRNKLSQPIAEYLKTKKPYGRVLYHGVGRDDIGAQALGAEKHDPFHPDPKVRENPTGKFHEVHSHYTLNVVDKPTGYQILRHIHGLLDDEGRAVISVRRDVPNVTENPKLVKTLRKSGIPEVASVAMVCGNKILMGRRQDNGKFTFPGGHLNPQEKPRDGAKRELFEESGIQPDKIHYLGSERVTSKNGAVLVHSFVAFGNYPTTSKGDPDKEVDKWFWVDITNGLPKEIEQNLHSPKNLTLKLLGLQKW
jgi:8-oxo-dGTP pyrophosphatase MutT (NUDIX family)